MLKVFSGEHEPARSSLLFKEMRQQFPRIKNNECEDSESQEAETRACAGRVECIPGTPGLEGTNSTTSAGDTEFHQLRDCAWGVKPRGGQLKKHRARNVPMIQDIHNSDRSRSQAFADEANAALQELAKESDRGAVLVGVAYLDELLVRLFKAKMILTKALSDYLFESSGPLSTLSSR